MCTLYFVNFEFELDFFKHRESVFKKQCLNKGDMFFQQTNASLKAFYEVSLMIAKQKKAHTIGENLVLPATCKSNGTLCLWR